MLLESLINFTLHMLRTAEQRILAAVIVYCFLILPFSAGNPRRVPIDELTYLSQALETDENANVGPYLALELK